MYSGTSIPDPRLSALRKHVILAMNILVIYKVVE